VSAEAIGVWVGVALTVAVQLVGYGSLKQQVKDMKDDIRELKKFVGFAQPQAIAKKAGK
jgi:hypothetical protein